MKKANFILGITALSTMPALGQTASSRPNIVYILMDDLGFGDIGCYGQEKIETPHIDQLRQEGMRFTQHYTGSPVSAPARCVLMTGMHSGHAQIPTRPVRLLAAIRANSLTLRQSARWQQLAQSS